MVADTKVFQDMADAMLPLFDNMPRPIVLVEDNEVFRREPYPLAVYSSPNIIINPSHARTCSYDEIQETICHELIHAWLQWKGLEGEFLDEHHDELFVKKALEINEKRIESLKVDVDYLLATPKAINIYNRVAGIQFAPYLRHKVRKIMKTVAAYTRQAGSEIFDFSLKDRLSKVVIISFLVVVMISFFSKVRLIPEAVVTVVWWTWSVGMLVALAVKLSRTR